MEGGGAGSLGICAEPCRLRASWCDQDGVDSHVYKTRLDKFGRPISDKTKHDVRAGGRRGLGPPVVNLLTVVTVMVVAMWVCAQLGNTFTSEESIQKHVETSTGGEAKEGSEDAGSKGGEGGEAAAAGDNKAAAATKCGTCYGAGDEGQVSSQWTASGREVEGLPC